MITTSSAETKRRDSMLNLRFAMIAIFRVMIVHQWVVSQAPCGSASDQLRLLETERKVETESRTMSMLFANMRNRNR